jgi:hypothetical protein
VFFSPALAVAQSTGSDFSAGVEIGPALWEASLVETQDDGEASRDTVGVQTRFAVRLSSAFDALGGRVGGAINGGFGRGSIKQDTPAGVTDGRVETLHGHANLFTIWNTGFGNALSVGPWIGAEVDRYDVSERPTEEVNGATLISYMAGIHLNLVPNEFTAMYGKVSVSLLQAGSVESSGSEWQSSLGGVHGTIGFKGRVSPNFFLFTEARYRLISVGIEGGADRYVDRLSSLSFGCSLEF